MNTTLRTDSPLFEVRFASPYHSDHRYAFACDSQGHVDLDALSERARNDYLFARGMVGREMAVPRICAQELGFQHHPAIKAQVAV